MPFDPIRPCGADTRDHGDDDAELLTRFLQRPAPAHHLALAGLKPAAVLIPLVERPEGLHCC
jgi:hypothetical protein